jgi:rubrerythrin
MPEKNAIQNAIDFAIATEEMGARTYTSLAKRFADQKELQETFALLARDEEAHKAQFQSLQDKVPPAAAAISRQDDTYRYLRAMAMSEFFDREKGPVKALEQARTVQDVLPCVLGVEKATLGYYIALREAMGGNEILDVVIRAEKQHVTRLMKYILTDEKMKGLGDPF